MQTDHLSLHPCNIPSHYPPDCGGRCIMHKLFPVKFAPALAGLLLASQAQADSPASDTLQKVRDYAEPSRSVGQVTSVTQFTDVQPNDWAYQALQSLVERYGCIVGYPDQTYRGNRPLSRYEFDLCN